jgi:ethanolamine transporter EutH
VGARVRLVVYGLLEWAIPFAVAFAMAPARDNWRSLFESVMAVTLAVTTTIAALSLLCRNNQQYVATGITAGIVWMVMSIVIDLPLMLSEPIAMPLQEYSADIGLTYLMIPVITIGIGVAMAREP